MNFDEFGHIFFSVQLKKFTSNRIGACEQVQIVKPLLRSITKFLHLLYKVTTQYVQIYNIVDTSIKHQISGQSTSTLKGYRPM